MSWIMRFLHWLFGVGPEPTKHKGGEWLGPERAAREHHRTHLHRGWHRDPSRAPWCKSKKLRTA